MGDKNYLEIFSTYKGQFSFINSIEKSGVYCMLIDNGIIVIPIRSKRVYKAQYFSIEDYRAAIDYITDRSYIIEDVALDDNPLRTMLSDEDFPTDLSTLQIATPSTMYIIKHKNKGVVTFVTKLLAFNEISDFINQYFNDLSVIYSVLDLRRLTVGTTFT
uniref:p17 n=1 Tax=Olive leaf yellowing-associated virus TaxID=82791 RepID=A0A7L9K427_9CLOS|nr:p17 [Olive leaf yellowing-associated virus]